MPALPAVKAMLINQENKSQKDASPTSESNRTNPNTVTQAQKRIQVCTAHKTYFTNEIIEANNKWPLSRIHHAKLTRSAS